MISHPLFQAAQEKSVSIPLVKKNNLKVLILQALHVNGHLSIPDLAQLSRTSSPTIKKVLDELAEDYLIIEDGLGKSGGGRRPSLYALNPNSRFILGIDFGRYQIRMGLFNLASQLIGDIQIVQEGLETHGDILNLLKEAVDKLIESNGITKEVLLGAGIAFPGLIDIRTGFSFSYFSQYEIPAAQLFEEELKMPVYVEHDTRAMALGEASFGMAKGRNNVLCLNIGSGVGLSMIMNGQLYKGMAGFSGEFGHIPMVNDGQLCRCGKVGCLETVASTTSLLRRANHDINTGTGSLLASRPNRDGKPVSLKDLLEAAEAGDQYTIGLFSEAGLYLGKGIATLIHLFNPDLIIIGGEMAQARHLLLVPIQQNLKRYAIPRILHDTEIVISDLGENAGLFGTASLVVERVFAKAEN